LDFHRHHIIFAVVAIITAIAFLLWYAPLLGFLSHP
jgi:hypothetical protein